MTGAFQDALLSLWARANFDMEFSGLLILRSNSHSYMFNFGNLQELFLFTVKDVHNRQRSLPVFRLQPDVNNQSLIFIVNVTEYLNL